MRKITELQAQDAWVVIQKWEDQNIAHTFKFERKDGVKYIVCQHLKEKVHTVEVGNIWLGDNMRVICCSVCMNVHLGKFVSLMNFTPYENIPEEKDKVEIRNDWKNWLRELVSKK